MSDKKIALVTGANKGLGFEISKGLARKGLTVIMGARDVDKGKEAVSKLKEKGLDVYFHILDVTDPESIKKAVRHISEDFGRIDILVNNAGIMPDRESSIMEVSIDILKKTMDTNVYGPYLLCQQVIPLMKKYNYGRIVNMTSTLGSIAEMAKPDSPFNTMDLPGYRMSKTALNVVTLLFTKVVKGSNILVNSVCPGWCKTDMGGSDATLTPEQGADTAVWLATLPDDGPSGGLFSRRKPGEW